MKKLFFVTFLVFASFVLQAQIPAGYYNNAEGKTGVDLKIALHGIICNHTEIGYKQVWKAFQTTDCRPNTNKIWDIYSDNPNGTPPYEYTYSTDQCGTYNGEGDCYNREHSWPQSWFNNASVPTSDLHHIYPTDGKVNQQRGNHPYGEVGNATWTSQNGSKLGSCVTPGYTGTEEVFEPIDEYKGDIARGLFYMSVRYYNDDSNWSTSGMTNKSVIKDWAMTMLLRWSDEDPVSQKEIARNNAVYNIQNNRNPFIDHPEYARMIWDPTYNANSYNITYASNLGHGSVLGPTSSNEGSTVAIEATPDPGYMVSNYSVRMTDSPYTAVTVSSNGTFTMPGYAVTVSATFVQNNTNYSITLVQPSNGGTIGVVNNVTSALSGTTISLTASPSNGYSLYSWYVYKTGDMGTIVYQGTTNSFTMPAFNVTVTASFVAGTTSSGDYVKVTSAPSDWSGTYLIVYENANGNKAFDGSLTTLDATGNNIEVTITNGNTIAATSTVNASNFTIEKTNNTNNYYIRSASGKYIGNESNSNALTSSNNPINNTISYDGTNNCVNIISSGGAYLRYNNASDQNRFRYFKSSSYSNQQPIQLYKRGTTTTTTTPTHTIHFDKNGGSGTMSDQTVNEMDATALTPNAFTRTNHVFDGWNTAANGTGDYYADGATITLLGNITLYAQWEPLFTITCNSVANGTISANPASAVEGTAITLTATPNAGYELDSWIVTYGDNNEVFVIDNEFDMPASNVTVSATFVYVGEPFTQKYYLVTSTDQLVAGRTYLIVNTSAGKALGTTQNNNNRSAANVTISSNVISSIGNDVCELTLGGQSGAWTFHDANWGDNGGYLYAASSSSNNLKTQATNDTNGQWSIEIATNGTATIVAQGSNTRSHLRYNPNSNNPIFSCYASSSDLAKAELYIRSEEIDHDNSETIVNLFDFDRHTVASGATLTVTGTATCTDPANLIIEDGAQFIHQNGSVKATVKKSVAGYVGKGGWYTIAAPFTTFNPSEVATDSYDLYAFDENANLEWINYKAHDINHGDDFPVSQTSGYLYAHYPNTTLRMTGTLNSGTYSSTVNLSYSNSDPKIKGYNLLGNPTTHAITFTKTDNVSNGYYYLNNSEVWMYEPNNSVPAGRGFLVKANAENQTVTLNPQSKGRGDDQGQYMCISIGEEKAYIKLTEGVSMPLLSFRGQHSNLYLSRDGQSYIMLVRDGANSVELNYQVRHDGRHKLSVDTKGLGLEELYLVDRLAGTTVDLLKNPDYTFEGAQSDDTARFQLIFTRENNAVSESFAYVRDGKIVLFDENTGDATLQVIDMMGRIIVSRDAARYVSTSEMTPGVYVLRLITDESTRMQKIVVK